jgi:hypothetical protein
MARKCCFDHPTENEGVMVQFAAGTVEPGEKPEDAVVRELMAPLDLPGRTDRHSERRMAVQLRLWCANQNKMGTVRNLNRS